MFNQRDKTKSPGSIEKRLEELEKRVQELEEKFAEKKHHVTPMPMSSAGPYNDLNDGLLSRPGSPK